MGDYRAQADLLSLGICGSEYIMKKPLHSFIQRKDLRYIPNEQEGSTTHQQLMLGTNGEKSGMKQQILRACVNLGGQVCEGGLVTAENLTTVMDFPDSGRDRDNLLMLPEVTLTLNIRFSSAASRTNERLN